MPIATGPHIQRFERLIGCSIDQIDSSALERLIGVEEDQHLDFKLGLYDLSLADEKDELCKDVTAMANASGGVIIRGIAETRSGVASKVLGVSIDLKHHGQMIDILRRVTPEVPGLEIHPTSGPDPRCYLILVPPSPLTPHGYRPDGDDKKHHFLFPVRAGTGTQCMTESQLAHRYRDRFELARSQEKQLLMLHDRVIERLTYDIRCWVIIVVVPTLKGSFAITRQTVDATEEWFFRRLDHLPPRLRPDMPTDAIVQVSYRAIEIRRPNPKNQSSSANISAILSEDGASAVAIEIDKSVSDRQYIDFRDMSLVGGIGAALSLAFDHALRTGASGDAIALSSLFTPGTSGMSTPWKFRLVHSSSSSDSAVPMTPAAPHHVRSEQTVDLAPGTRNTRGLMECLGQVAASMFQHLGLPDSGYLSTSGGLRPRRWHPRDAAAVREYATWHDVEIEND